MSRTTCSTWLATCCSSFAPAIRIRVLDLVPKQQPYSGVLIVKVNFISFAGMFVITLAILVVSPSRAFAQEGEVTVVDEVIAQVNDDVITLSMLKRETKERIEALKQSGMTEQQAMDEVSKRQNEL